MHTRSHNNLAGKFYLIDIHQTNEGKPLLYPQHSIGTSRDSKYAKKFVPSVIAENQRFVRGVLLEFRGNFPRLWPASDICDHHDPR